MVQLVVERAGQRFGRPGGQHGWVVVQAPILVYAERAFELRMILNGHGLQRPHCGREVGPPFHQEHAGYLDFKRRGHASSAISFSASPEKYSPVSSSQSIRSFLLTHLNLILPWVSIIAFAQTKSPSAYSLLPSAYSLSPSAYSLAPSAYSLSASAYSLLPSAYSLSPSACSLAPSACSLSASACSLAPSACSLSPSAQSLRLNCHFAERDILTACRDA